jgi:hypothetical protein
MKEGAGKAFWGGAQWALRPAVLFVLAYAVMDLAGFRQDTTFLSGTMVDGNWNRTTALGGAYIAAYLGWTIAVPILAIAGTITGVFAVGKRDTPV